MEKRGWCETESCIWCTEDLKVEVQGHKQFYGYLKPKGGRCIANVCNCERDCRTFAPKLRELQHENLLQLFKIERDLSSQHLVLITEVPSLENVADQLARPSSGYLYGLPEDEIRLFLCHVTKGLLYLKNQNLFPTKIIPSNIFRCTNESGDALYKLSLFHEDSLVSLTDKESESEVRAISKSLWTLGITMHHVCTGESPFPFVGYDYNQICGLDKPKGRLCGTRQGTTAELNLEYDFPVSCQLSKSFKNDVKPLLSGLIECKIDNQLTPDIFFQTAQSICEKYRLQVYCTIMGRETNVYLKKTDTYEDLAQALFQLVEIPPGQQLLLYGDDRVCDIVDISRPLKNYPVVQNSILFLYDKGATTQQSYTRKLPHLPDLHELESKDPGDLEDAVLFCRKVETTIYFACKKFEEMVSRQNMQENAEHYLRRFAQSALENLQNRLKKRIAGTESVRTVLESSNQYAIVVSRIREFDEMLAHVKTRLTNDDNQFVSREMLCYIPEFRRNLDFLRQRITSRSSTVQNLQQTQNVFASDDLSQVHIKTVLRGELPKIMGNCGELRAIRDNCLEFRQTTFDSTAKRLSKMLGELSQLEASEFHMQELDRELHTL